MMQETQDSEEIIERVAALDIGKAELVVCVRVPGPARPGRRSQEIAHVLDDDPVACCGWPTGWSSWG